jgi:hypothetical protein
LQVVGVLIAIGITLSLEAFFDCMRIRLARLLHRPDGSVNPFHRE